MTDTPEARLLALAERCEAETGPDAELNKLIWEALGNCAHRETEYYAVQSDTGFTCTSCRKDMYGVTRGPPYSASLDAAMTIYPNQLPPLVPSNPRACAADALRVRALAQSQSSEDRK